MKLQLQPTATLTYRKAEKTKITGLNVLKLLCAFFVVHIHVDCLYSQPQLLHNSPTLHRYGAFRKTKPKASCTHGRVQVYVRRCCTVVSCRSSRAHVAEKHKSGSIQHTLIHAACSHVTLPVRSSTLQSEPMAERRKLWSALLGKHILLAPFGKLHYTGIIATTIGSNIL